MTRLVAVVSSFAVYSTLAFAQQPWPPSPHVASTPPLTPAEQRKKFHLPPGFEIELVAAEPAINKPINIAFDAKGRLWVTGSVEYPFAAKEGKGRDKVWVLSDFAADGKAKKVEVFADELNIPIGVLPLPDCKSALVYSIPNIYKLTDTDGDGKADKKEVLYSGYGFGDTHGMTGEFTWGLDGWIYCCHGFSNTSKVKSKGDTAITMQSGNTYRIKPDGSKIEQWTWGQVNPFGLTFDPLGNLYSTDCHTRPLYQLLRGAHYPHFGGKADDGLGFGPEMVTHDHGSTAIAGIAYYAADQYPKEFRDNLFVGNVVTNRINRDKIEWHGSTPKGIEMPDFVKCDDPWFRPVDIKLGPDGCLYVADFYNRIIGHYEVPLDHPGRDREKGRIWRIVYRGEDGKSGPRPVADLVQGSAKELIDALKSPNLEVRTQATNQLVARGGDETIKLALHAVEKGERLQQVHALWVLYRLSKLDDALLLRQLNLPAREVQVQALKVLAERPKWTDDQHELAINLLGDIDPLLQRAAAEALGQRPSAKHVPPLLKLTHAVPAKDTHLRHVVRMALRDQFYQNGKVRNGLIYLWQTQGLSEQDGHVFADISLGVPHREAADYLLKYLTYSKLKAVPQAEAVVRHVARFTGDPGSAQRQLSALFEEQFSNDYVVQTPLLKAIHQGTQERGAKVDAKVLELAELAAHRLLDAEPRHMQLGVELADLFRLPDTQPDLIRLLANVKVPEETRKNAVSALAAIDLKRNGPVLAELLANDKASPGVREQAAKVLASSPAPDAQKAVVQALEKASAATQTVIAISLASSQQGGDKLLDAIAQGKASPRLLQDRAVTERLRQARIADLDNRLAKLTKGLPPADQRMHELLIKKRDAFDRGKASMEAGLKVFTKHCAACHQIANQGAKIGPQLDGIGIRGLERLLEDILDPNRNVDQAFRATTLVLKDGKLVTGLFLREEGKVLIMADNLGKEVRIDAKDVDERHVGQLSPMPSNFGEQIAAGEFNDLLAYLLAQRVKE